MATDDTVVYHGKDFITTGLKGTMEQVSTTIQISILKIP